MLQVVRRRPKQQWTKGLPRLMPRLGIGKESSKKWCTLERPGNGHGAPRWSGEAKAVECPFLADGRPKDVFGL
jgi:hypothetical protein